MRNPGIKIPNPAKEVKAFVSSMMEYPQVGHKKQLAIILLILLLVTSYHAS